MASLWGSDLWETDLVIGAGTTASRPEYSVLNLVNMVLRRLRESEVATPRESEYSSLISDFLVDIHMELLQHEWSSMEHTLEVPIDSGQRILDLSRFEVDGGDVLDTSRLPSSDSIPVWAQMFASSTDTQGADMNVILPMSAEGDYNTDRSLTEREPLSVAFRSHPDRDGIEATLWSVPNTDCYMRVRMWTPEESITVEDDADRVLLTPWRPLYLGTLFLALNERGEEIGEPGGLAETRYKDSVDIARESGVRRNSNAGQFVAGRE